MPKIIVLAAIIAAILAGSYFLIKKSNIQVPVPGLKQIISPDQIKYETVEVKEETDVYIINVKYPVFKIPPDSKGESILNEAIKQAVFPFVDGLKKTAAERFEEGSKSGLDVTYKVPLLDQKIISVEFLISDYDSGAAHPNDTIITINYSFKKQKVLALEDLFKPGSNYQKRLSDYAFEDIKKSDINDDERWIKKGTTFNIENYKSFRPDKDKLVLIFDPYQVASYATGFISVEVPYENLKDILQYDLVVREKSSEELKVESDLHKKLNRDNDAKFKLEVKKVSGNFAKGVVSLSVDGYDWIAVKKDGVWEKIWAGQDAPDCKIMEMYEVPKEIYEACS